MKKLLSSFPLLLLVSQLNAQSAKYSWNTTIGASGNEHVNSVITDPMGNVYTVGKFSGTVDFAPGPGEFNLTAFGSTDVYVSKQDPNGAFLWARNFGGGTEDEGISISLDPTQNVYLTGNFTGVADFNPGMGAGNVSSMGGKDIFTVKLDKTGFFYWVRRMGTNGPDEVQFNTWERTGFFYSTGSTWSTTRAAEVFISKIDMNGFTYWTRTFGSDGMDMGYGVATDRFGNVYAIGTFEGSGDFDPASGVTRLSTIGMKDIFIVKFNPLGSLVWAKQIGGPGNDIGKSIHINDSDKIYITGSFSSVVDFHPSTSDEDTNFLESYGASDMFLAQLDLSGNLLWAKHAGALDADCAGISVKSDIRGDVVVTGVFTDTVDFDTRLSKEQILKSAGNHDVFISKYDSNGDFIWVKQYGGPFEDSCTDIEIDMASNIITTGTFQDSVDFNPAKEVNKAGSIGKSDAFVNKLVYCTPTYTSIKDTICKPFTLDGVTYDKTGIYTQTITGVSGCEEFVTLDIDIRTFNDTISKSGVVLTSHADGLKYQWIECTSKKEIPGATGKSYIALGNNKYAVTLFDGRCRDTSDCIEISSFTTSMEEFALQNSVQIFPNPSNGEFVIAVNENMLGAKAGIYNLLGQKVREVELNESNTKQSLTPGFYILEITKEQKRFTKKLLVE